MRFFGRLGVVFEIAMMILSLIICTRQTLVSYICINALQSQIVESEDISPTSFMYVNTASKNVDRYSLFRRQGGELEIVTSTLVISQAASTPLLFPPIIQLVTQEDRNEGK